MGLNVAVGTATDLNSTGNKTISLASNFDPRAIICWGHHATADGSSAHRHFCRGFATYRASTVSQWYSTMKSLDAAGSAALGCGHGTGALYRLYNNDGADNVTVDVEVDLVSMSTGATSNVVYNVANAHASAIRMNYMILGGSDVTDALVGTSITNGSAGNHDVTVASGFGKPELTFFSGVAWSAQTDVLHTIYDSFGWGIQGQAGRCNGTSMIDGNTATILAMSQRADRCLHFFVAAASSATVETEARLDTTAANWPTDGFRLIETTDSVGERFGYLAIRTTAQMLDGADAALTSGADQDDDVGFTPKGVLVSHWNQPSSASINTTASDLGAVGIGAYDGTTEAWAGWSEDDAILTMDSNSQSSTAKIIRNYNNAAALQSEADAVFTGTTFRRTWTDLDTVAREHQWLVLGDAAGGAVEGASSSAYTFGATTNAKEQAKTATATPITFGSTTNAKDIAKSATATPITFGATTNGVAFVAPKLGASASAYTFGSTTNASSKAYSATATPLTFGATTADTSKAYSATASAYTFGSTTASKRAAKTSTLTPLVFSSTTNATSKAYGSTTTPLVWDATTNGTTPGATPHSSLTFPITFGSTTSGKAGSYAASATSITVSTATGATSKAFGALVYALTWDAVSDARTRSYGVALLPIVWDATTNNLSVIVMSFFGGPSPAGGIVSGTPQGGSQAGTPGSGAFGPPSPSKG